MSGNTQNSKHTKKSNGKLQVRQRPLEEVIHLMVLGVQASVHLVDKTQESLKH